MARSNAGTAARRPDKWGGMPTFAIDPVSVSGKSVPVAETTTVLVIGAGAAGCTAAIEGAQRGLHVVLVDENPIDFETMCRCTLAAE